MPVWWFGRCFVLWPMGASGISPIAADGRYLLRSVSYNVVCTCVSLEVFADACSSAEVFHWTRFTISPACHMIHKMHFQTCTLLIPQSRSSIIWPRKDIAGQKLCCAWSLQTKRSMDVLCLHLEKMRAPSIEWGSVSGNFLIWKVCH